MLIRSLEEMLKIYGIETLDTGDQEDRIGMLSKYPYSVIFEGDFLEYDNLESWIRENLKAPTNFLFSSECIQTTT
jgi:hypothetical protein